MIVYSPSSFFRIIVLNKDKMSYRTRHISNHPGLGNIGISISTYTRGAIVRRILVSNADVSNYLIKMNSLRGVCCGVRAMNFASDYISYRLYLNARDFYDFSERLKACQSSKMNTGHLISGNFFTLGCSCTERRRNRKNKRNI